MAARGVQISIRDKNLYSKQWQMQMEYSSQCAADIPSVAKALFGRSYRWNENVRAVTVRAINLIPAELPVQLSLFDDNERREKLLKIERSIDEIRGRFGYEAVTYASLMGDLKMPEHRKFELTMPALAVR